MFATMNRLDLKLIFWTSFLTVLIIVAYALHKFPQERQALMKQMDAQGGSLTYALAKAAVGPILYDDIPALQSLAESLIEKDNSVAFIRIMLADEENTRVAEEFASAPDAPSRTYRERIEVSEDYQLGVVEIGVLTAPTEALINARMWSLGIASALIILIKIITEFVVIGKMVRHPLRILAERATQLGQGDLETIIALPGRDELVLLANTLDGMRQNLRNSYNKIRRQNEELKQLDQMKDDFLANVTHELKTPLNGILGLGKAIQDGAYGALPETLCKPLGQIVFSADRLLKLALQILAFTPDKQTRINIVALPLQDYLNTFVEPFKEQARQVGITLDVQVDPTVQLPTDPTHMDTVLMNVIGNALKFTHEGHVRILVHHLGADAIALSVEDTGIGIPKALHGKIFERFQQGFASESRAYEGSGLGLAIATQALTLLQGTIHLESTPGVGSIFTILLPLREGTTADLLQTLWSQHTAYGQHATLPLSDKLATREVLSHPGPESMPQQSGVTHTAPMTEEMEGGAGTAIVPISPTEEEVNSLQGIVVLVADDDAINREVIRANLTRNFRVVEAEDGASCLEMIQKEKFDLLLLDIMMPGISGYDVLATLQESHSEQSSLPVVVLSAKDQPSAITKAFKMGAVDYVTKPFHREELLARIQTHVTLRRNAHEIMTQKVTEARLREKKALAETADQAKSEFLANMSHEIRTPMNAIIGLSQLALKTELSNKQRDYLVKIQSSAHNLLGIINDILDFSKIEAGKLSLESVPFYLDKVLDDLFYTLQVKVEEKNLEMLIKCPREVPTELEGDPLRLRQVLINLGNNAVKFTEQGGTIILTVAVAEETPEKIQLHYSVQDTGIGMTQKQLEQLFKPFSQADGSTTRQYGGTGLGLAICKRIVEMMHGRIWVESTWGQGSTFHFTADFKRSVGLEKRHLVVSEDLKGMRVLAVDDNEASREILEDVLRGLSFEPTLLASGEEALAELDASDAEKRPYPLLLLDWRMPGMNGLEVSQAIRKRRQKSIKIIMLTAFAREDIMQKAQGAGVNAFLLKPVNASLLFDTIMEVFGKEVDHPIYRQEEQEDLNPLLEPIVGAKILLVEDTPINQQVAQEILEGAGFIIEVACHGEEAVQKVAQSPFDLVLMDVQMPKMDGYAATSQIRRDARFKTLPIIAMTAHAMASDREKCLKAGMDDFLTKPIDTNQLFATLSQWIKPGKRQRPIRATREKDSDGSGDKASLTDLSGIQISAALKRLGGNQMLFRKLWSDFKRDYAHAAEEIRAMLDQGEGQEMARQKVHTIKGVAGNLGANTLHQAARELDTAIKQEDRETWPERLAMFEKNMKEVLASVSVLEQTATEPKEESTSIQMLPLDPQEIRPLLIALIDSLKVNNINKIEDNLRVLEGQVRKMGLSREMVQLEACIDQFDFEGALTAVAAMAQALDIALDV